MKFLHWLLRKLMSPVEEAMIRRLLHQRDDVWHQADHYRRKLGMKLGEFDEEKK